ncbi:hypothetical protein [Candidatus Similichlamydia laticola]|uniref:Transmembrane protein n=1 Tax=Candidatus Similichlamydia laticola TaxID=2170265 RepID=A0A369KFN2_9BACT|nr:hypothetical protein [Candidatus Similichlamydia laticola]RDB31505.1 hypothetical protein HAT2_00379 [Candidatus Similichlamydia laticola]
MSPIQNVNNVSTTTTNSSTSSENTPRQSGLVSTTQSTQVLSLNPLTRNGDVLNSRDESTLSPSERRVTWISLDQAEQEPRVRSESAVTSILTTQCPDERVREILRERHGPREKLFKAVITAASVAATALLVSALSSTDFSWIGYSVAAATAFSSQVLIAVHPSRSITHYASQIVSAMGGLGRRGSADQADGAGPNQGRGRGIGMVDVRRRLSVFQERIQNIRRPSTVESEGGVEGTSSLPPLSELVRLNPSRWQEILIHQRAVVCALATSVFSMASLSYLTAALIADLSGLGLSGLLAEVSTTTSPTTTAFTEWNTTVLGTTESGVFDVRQARNEEVVIDTDIENHADELISIIMQELGPDGVLLLCHALAFMYNLQRLFRARSKGRQLLALAEEEEVRTRESAPDIVITPPPGNSDAFEIVDETRQARSSSNQEQSVDVEGLYDDMPPLESDDDVSPSTGSSGARQVHETLQSDSEDEEFYDVEEDTVDARRSVVPVPPSLPLNPAVVSLISARLGIAVSSDRMTVLSIGEIASPVRVRSTRYEGSFFILPTLNEEEEFFGEVLEHNSHHPNQNGSLLARSNMTVPRATSPSSKTEKVCCTEL